MKFTVSRESLLRPLQLVSGVVERRQTLPVLANVLIELDSHFLSLTGTDLEVEIRALIGVEDSGLDIGSAKMGRITVPARKLLDICRSLPDDSDIHFSVDNQKALVQCGRSRFTLTTLPADDFPKVQPSEEDFTFVCPQKTLKRLIERTSFAMAQQDVRYYLNGMLWEINQGGLRVVATDGHRLAMCTNDIDVSEDIKKQAILPRKGVLELSRLLAEEGDAEVSLGSHHIRVNSNEYIFTSKLVDGKFPDYERVLPVGGNKLVFANRDLLKQALARASILSNEKYRGVRLLVSKGLLKIVANNPEQEQAEEEVVVDYSGSEIEIGFNVSYLQDVANVLSSENVQISLSDSNSSALLQEPDEDSDSLYVVMPMRL